MNTVPATRSYAHTVGDLYGVAGRYVILPKGWDYLDFRPIKQGEYYLSTVTHQIVVAPKDYPNYARIIVSKAPTVQHIFTEDGPPRLPCAGEYFLTEDATGVVGIHKVPPYWDNTRPRQCLKYERREV